MKSGQEVPCSPTASTKAGLCHPKPTRVYSAVRYRCAPGLCPCRAVRSAVYGAVTQKQQIEEPRWHQMALFVSMHGGNRDRHRDSTAPGCQASERASRAGAFSQCCTAGRNRVKCTQPSWTEPRSCLWQHDWATVSFAGGWCEEERGRMQPRMGSAVRGAYVAAGNANLPVGRERAAREIQTGFMGLFCFF